MKHTLKGITSTKKVYLDGILLDPNKTNLVISQNEFDWGNKSKGTSLLAYCIIQQLTGSYDGYHKFKFEILSKLTSNRSFKITFDSPSPIMETLRDLCIANAIAYNKFLTRSYLINKSNDELLCFVHPIERATYSYRMRL